MKYWIFKSEPDVYSIDDLKKDKKACWEGVRNYQARNFMMNDMKIGDKVLFYHSNAKEIGIVGLCEVCKESYPDYHAWDKKSKYFDEKSPKDKPRWFMVDVKFLKKFDEVITLQSMKENKKLADMRLVKKGNRLSIIPITASEFKEITKNYL
jgi:predicted RNA-binding protein with PUA-like domain